MTCRICGASLPEGALFCGECGSSTSATAASRAQPDPRPRDTTVVRPLSVGARPAVPAPADTTPPAAPGHELRFSTGEVVRVTGTGLIGRRPLAQPGESFDRMVPIEDPGLSVSKTHLEYGDHEGRLWVCDRFSSNGTVIRARDGSVQRCEPGRRYLVERGGRVDIGEQHFIVV